MAIRAVRDGQICQLVQKVSPSGIPCCVECLRAIPAAYRRWKSRPLFCSDAHARKWAEWAAGQVYPARETEVKP